MVIPIKILQKWPQTRASQLQVATNLRKMQRSTKMITTMRNTAAEAEITMIIHGSNLSSSSFIGTPFVVRVLVIDMVTLVDNITVLVGCIGPFVP